MRSIKRYIPTALLLMLVLPKTVFSTNYYISNSGNDNHSGIEPELAWRTISQLNASFLLMQPGDSILFKRGEVFFGTITVRVPGRLGRPIVFSAYGKGNDPVITGFRVIKGWTKKEGKIWQAPAPGIMNNLNMVTMDDQPQRIGRYPNADQPDGGYLRYENADGSTSITDDDLNTSTNWTGAEVVIRKNHWSVERCHVTKQNGKTITFTNACASINTTTPPKLYDGTKGFGYFFQKDHRTLDQQGEWFLDSTNGYLQMVLNDTTHLIKVAAVDTLVNTGNMSFLTFSQLSFEGANRSAVYNKDGGHITIQHCSFKNIGAKAVQFLATNDVLIENVNTNNILSNAIQVRNTKKDNVTVKNCVIKNTALLIGMGSFFDDRDYKAVFVSGNNVLVENNIIDSVGLSGIQFQGNHVLIRHNLVNHYCRLLDDGGGIYTFVEIGQENAKEVFTDRVIKNNIILNGRGAPEGSTKIYKAEGIYLDGRTMNTMVLDNSIAYTGNKALACNNPVNVYLKGNNCFNTGGGWGAGRGVLWHDIHNFNVTGNIFYAVNDQQGLVNFSHSGLDVPAPVTIWEAIRLAGEIDSNYYNTVNPVAFVYSYAPAAGRPVLFPSPLTFEHWQEYTGQDAHSKRPSKIFPRYVFKNNIGNNLVKNGEFNDGMADISIYGSGVEGQWDNSGKITGKGSLKIECNQPQPNRYTIVHGAVGNLQAGKKYMFRFKTLGTSDCGIVRAYLRKTASPYDMLTPIQVQSFGTGKQEHEFLLAPTAPDKMSFVIEVEKNSCTAYIDDIELYEADATVINITDHVRFEYNAADKTVEIPLDKNYVGVDGTKYSNMLTLLPFTSKILIEDITY